MEPNETSEQTSARPRYRWPFVLGAIVLLGVILAILWMSAEIRRTQRIRDANAPSAGQKP